MVAEGAQSCRDCRMALRYLAHGMSIGVEI